MIVVDLTWREVHLAGIVAVSRSVLNFAGKRKDTYNFVYSGLGIEEHWLGTLGEIALGKHLDRYWTPLELGTVDVGGCEVRAIDVPTKRLRLHPKDNDASPFISALVERKKLPQVTLRGWLHARDGKLPQYWSDPTGKNRPAFFVDNAILRPMETLREEIG